MNKTYHDIIDSNLYNNHLNNINFLDTYTIKNIRYLIIYGDDYSNFKFNKLIIHELTPPFGNAPIRNNIVMKIQNNNIYKTSYKKYYKVPCILDSFTETCLSYELNLLPLTVKNYIEVLEDDNIDFVLFESAWQGNNGEWSNCIANYNNEKGKNSIYLNEILSIINNKRIKKVFYNKEDPIHYNKFIDFAKLFNKDNDLVITTDDSMVDNYKSLGIINVISFPFCCQPIIHNPVNKKVIPNHNLIFPCSYYQRTFPDRCTIMDDMLDSINLEKVDIFDRQYVYNKMVLQCDKFIKQRYDYRFPDRFTSRVKGYLNYNQLLHITKKYKAVLNINTIQDSPSMFSRRVMECASLGIPIISNKSIGMTNIFGNYVIHYKDVKNINKILNYPIYRKYLGNQLYKIAMKKYKYSDLIKQITNIFNLEDKTNNVKLLCIIFMDSISNLSRFLKYMKKYDYVIISDTIKSELYNVKSYNDINSIRGYDYYCLMNESCNYENDYIENMLLPFLFTDSNIVGKGCYYYMTKSNILNKVNENTFSSNIHKDSIIVNNKISIVPLLNEYISNNISGYLFSYFDGKNIYSTDKEGFMDLNNKYHYHINNKIVFRKLVFHNKVDTYTIPIIMCTWKRINNITKTISCLNIQDDKNFELYIWNNNMIASTKIEKLIKQFNPKFNVYIFHCKTNIGGIGRFYSVNTILKLRSFDYVIFIDDDQIFDNKLVSLFRSVAKKKHSYNWYGRLFTKNKDYTYRENKTITNGSELQ
jgi:hypothetical protein